MNTPNHRPDPSHAPLDAEERGLAEALSSLPAAEPDSELDARILGMARAAVARPETSTRRAPRRRGGLLWMGSAAGAVLAAGLGWQLAHQQGQQLQGGVLDPSPAASAPARAQKVEEPADDSFSVEMIARPAPAPHALEKALSNDAPAEREAAADHSPRRRAQAAPKPSAEVPDLAPAATPAAPPPAAAPMTQPAPESASAELATSAEDASYQYGRASPVLDRIEVTGSRVRSIETLDAEGFPPVIQDARLKPEQWLLRIRARREAGQLEPARKSLQEFVRSYPYLVVPDDLRGLLNERP